MYNTLIGIFLCLLKHAIYIFAVNNILHFHDFLNPNINFSFHRFIGSPTINGQSQRTPLEKNCPDSEFVFCLVYLSNFAQIQAIWYAANMATDQQKHSMAKTFFPPIHKKVFGHRCLHNAASYYCASCCFHCLVVNLGIKVISLLGEIKDCLIPTNS